MIIIRAIEGIFVAGLIPAALSIITDITPESERGKWIGIFFAGFYLGFVGGPLLGGLAFDNFGFNSAFILSAFLSLLAGAVTYFVISETKGISSTGDAKNVLSITQVFKTQSFSWVLLFFVLLWISFFITFAWLFVEPGVTLYVFSVINRTPTDFGIIVSIYGAMLIIGQILFGSLSDKVSRHGLIIIGLVVYGVGFLFLIGDQSYFTFIIFGFLAGLGLSLISPSLNSLITLMTNDSNRGILLGVSSSITGLAGIFGPVIGGFLYESMTKTSTPVSALSSLFVISIAGIVFSIGLVIFRVYLTSREDRTPLTAGEGLTITKIFQFTTPLEFASSGRIRQTLERVWTQLTAVAYNDGIITQDEQSLLNQIMIDLQKYSEVLEIALEDGIITDDELVFLKEARLNLWSKANVVALQDAIISPDEQQILEKLKEIAHELELKEKDFIIEY